MKTFQEGFGQDGEGYGGQTPQNYLVQHETGVLQNDGIKGKSFIAVFTPICFLPFLSLTYLTPPAIENFKIRHSVRNNYFFRARLSQDGEYLILWRRALPFPCFHNTS